MLTDIFNDVIDKFIMEINKHKNISKKSSITFFN